MPKKELTIANANLKITCFLQSAKNLDHDKRAWLLDVQARIKAIHEANRDFNVAEIENPSQKAMMSHAVTYYTEARRGFKVSFNSLYRHVSKEKNAQKQCKNKAYVTIVSDIHACLTGVATSWEETCKKSSDTGKTTLLTRAFARQKDDAIYAQLCSGRFYPFRQEIDFCFGMEIDDREIQRSEGYCYGYVKAWAQDIAFHGAMTKTPRMDDLVFYEQTLAYTFSKMLSARLFSPWAADVGLQTNFPFLFNKMLLSLDRTKIYGLSLRFHNDEGHIIGIRFISATNEYEIFDPNNGIIVFNNRDKARDWLTYHFLKFYMEYVLGSCVKGALTLKPLANQPLTATSSLPMWEVKNYEPGLLKTRFAHAHLGPLRDAGFIERNLLPLISLAGFYALLICVSLTISSVAASIAFLSGVTSLSILACVFALPLITGIALTLAIAGYTMHKVIDSYRYAAPFGFFARHGSDQEPCQKPDQDITEDEINFAYSN